MRSTPPERSVCTAATKTPRRTASANAGGTTWKWTSSDLTGSVRHQSLRTLPRDQRDDLACRRPRQLCARVPGRAPVVRRQYDVVHLEELRALRHLRRSRRLVPEDI